MFNHILLEVYCNKNENANDCGTESRMPCYNCLINKCPYVSFTSHENAICYINEHSEASEIIALGGDMLPHNVDKQLATQRWEQISRSKIQQAYEEYMKEIYEAFS